MTKSAIHHVGRFSALLAWFLILPGYSFTSLPGSAAAGALTGLAILMLSIAGTSVYLWKMVRGRVANAIVTHNWRMALAVAAVADLAGVLLILALMTEPMVTLQGLVLLGGGMVLLGGAWAAGQVLSRIWDVTGEFTVFSLRPRRLGVSARFRTGGISHDRRTV